MESHQVLPCVYALESPPGFHDVLQNVFQERSCFKPSEFLLDTLGEDVPRGIMYVRLGGRCYRRIW